MPVSVLIPPDNRLLGWTLSDLTLYGAQPAPGMTIGAATNDATVPVGYGVPEASPPTATTAAPPESDLAAHETTALLDRDALPSPTVAAPSPASDHTAAPSDFAAQPDPVHAVGSGGVPFPAVATPLQIVGDRAAAPADGAAQSHDTPTSLAALSHDIGFATAPFGTVDHLVGELAPSALGTIDTLASAAVPATLATVDSLVGEVAPATLSTVDTLAGAVVPTTLATVDTLVGDIAPDLLGNGADTAGQAGSIVDTSLSAFGGSDPAAGVQTLIGMVESADTFDLGHAGTTQASDLTSSGSILDALAADEVAPALLGDDHGAAAEHPIDDHGIHLGL